MQIISIKVIQFQQKESYIKFSTNQFHCVGTPKFAAILDFGLLGCGFDLLLSSLLQLLSFDATTATFFALGLAALDFELLVDSWFFCGIGLSTVACEFCVELSEFCLLLSL